LNSIFHEWLPVKDEILRQSHRLQRYESYPIFHKKNNPSGVKRQRGNNLTNAIPNLVRVRALREDAQNHKQCDQANEATVAELRNERGQVSCDFAEEASALCAKDDLHKNAKSDE
jgi:hypothetical protein